MTLSTIADMTGLSLSTFSLSLRQRASLRQENRNKVAQAAKRLVYAPERRVR